ncbi:hypothetical protein C0J29_31695 (plasmid) [Mycobacterium paragordonae]|uniref:Uncharacterized protein n=1 Tax=Mycobacterium paragordonae TaxID=1389713 RepID=A0ABQ1CFJ2_9MYCO|nr:MULTISPECIES: hypothetical protein [Mycobacterium]AYE99531.1 hypothetical protein C0J29_31695 [Mycobacterium paragordonae]QNI09775.1 hypothetical protein GAN17_25630 [Mycobacterium kubicae]GFG83256.1 hypothetical protein MPRG_65320 [Mycobacterium paragordonae]
MGAQRRPPPRSPTREWQALVEADLPITEGPYDTALRLLLLLHYSIDWESSWVAEHRKTYWDHQLPSRVRTAAYRNTTLSGWWSNASGRLGALAPRQPERRRELATLLRKPPLPVIDELRTNLPALILEVRIIAEAVAELRTPR